MAQIVARKRCRGPRWAEPSWIRPVDALMPPRIERPSPAIPQSTKLGPPRIAYLAEISSNWQRHFETLTRHQNMRATSQKYFSGLRMITTEPNPAGILLRRNHMQASRPQTASTNLKCLEEAVHFEEALFWSINNVN